MSGARESWGSELLAAATRRLDPIVHLVDAADPRGTVLPRSRRLCAALGTLSELTYEALGGVSDRVAVGQAGALLGLLTKIDDEEIDSLAFHGGWRSDRRSVRERTHAHLAPTLASIKSARAANHEPRCALAADLGQRLRSLAVDPHRLDHVLSLIDRGWATQVDAVTILTGDPSLVTIDEVRDLTGRISGLWLLMISAIGELPAGASRSITPAEEAAFLAWGRHIQSADALADLEKDLREGLACTMATRMLFDRDRAAYVEGRDGNASVAYEAIAEQRIDLALIASHDEVNTLHTPLRELGEVSSLLEWIMKFLLARYHDHPLKHRENAISTRTQIARTFVLPEARCLAR